MFRDLQIVEPSDKIPPAELDENWFETTLEALNRHTGGGEARKASTNQEAGDGEEKVVEGSEGGEEKEEAAAAGDQEKDKAV